MPDETTPTPNDARTRAHREDILWQEFRSIRDLLFRVLQWGVTVLASLQTAIFFLRKEVKDTMVISGQLKASESIPVERYIVGTFVLLVVASICCYFVALLGNRYRKIREQLVATDAYGIEHGDVRKGARFAVFFVFLTFPLLDIAIRLWVHFEWK